MVKLLNILQIDCLYISPVLSVESYCQMYTNFASAFAPASVSLCLCLCLCSCCLCSCSCSCSCCSCSFIRNCCSCSFIRTCFHSVDVHSVNVNSRLQSGQVSSFHPAMHLSQKECSQLRVRGNLYISKHIEQVKSDLLKLIETISAMIVYA